MNIIKCALQAGGIWIWKCWFLYGGRKTGEPGEKPSEQGREPTTNSTHVWHRNRESNPGHIGGRRALSPLRHPCSQVVTGEIKVKSQNRHVSNLGHSHLILIKQRAVIFRNVTFTEYCLPRSALYEFAIVSLKVWKWPPRGRCALAFSSYRQRWLTYRLIVGPPLCCSVIDSCESIN